MGQALPWVYNDGGREAAGFKGATGDCGVRAIAIATGKPYLEIYNAINECAKVERTGKRKKGKSNARTGVYKGTFARYMESLGWRFVATMGIGTGCRVHLATGELPPGRIVAQVTRHWVAVIEGVAQDTYDPCRGGSRCVYGYWLPSGGLHI